MHDPLRERDLSGRRKAGSRRVTGWMLQRTSQLGGEPTDIAQPVGSTFHRIAAIAFDPHASLPPLGHNGGPLLAPDDPNEGWRQYCWRRAHKAAWKTPPREIALRRLERAEALGMTYHDYALEILERGRYL
jgi:hypothetical protein